MRKLFVLIAILLATAALAQPKPSTHLGDLSSFVGDWTCHGKTLASQFGPEHPTTASIHVSWVLGSFWLQAQYAEKKTPQNPHPASGHVYWGYDEMTKKLTGFGVNNFGGHVKIESDGWHGDTIIWTGTMSAGGATFGTRDTFIRKSSREVSHTTQAQMGANWTTIDEETCKKTSK